MPTYYRKGCRAREGGLTDGVYAIECNGDKTAFQWKILDQCSNQSKLMTLEALYIRTLKPAINTRDEYRTVELTLKA